MTQYERAAQLWSVLVLAARTQQVLSYRIVAALTGMPQQGLAPPLEQVQEYCKRHKLPPLTSLIVNEPTGLPSAGFTEAIDIFAAQARVFVFDWLDRRAPSPEDFEHAGQAGMGKDSLAKAIRRVRREHVEAALRDIDRDGLPRNRLATKYCLIMDNKHYPPKEVLKHASARAGTRIRMADGYELFGGEQTNKPLRDLGFTVMRCPDATAHKYPTLPGAGADPP